MALIGNTPEERTWNYLMTTIKNPFGVAGLMGNFKAESGIIFNRVEMLCLKRLREHGKEYSDATYTAAVDNGTISRAEFLNPLPGKQYGYGLYQLTSPGRKAGLYDLCKGRNVSIADEQASLDYLMQELQTSFKTTLSVLQSAKTVKEASDVVLKKFECPADTGSAVQATRAKYGQAFYDKYANKNGGGTNMADYSKYYNSTGTHYISNSGSDERGQYHGGVAGDQTGNEWCLRSWYSRPWTCVLRYEKDARVGMKLAELGCAAALNNKVGYDQYQRNTYWNQLKAAGYDPSKITVACEADCSAGVIANTKAVGHLLGIPALQNINATYTGNMRAGYKAAGFTVLTGSKYTSGYTYLLPGDILLYDSAHTATNITKGCNAVASTPSAPAENNKPTTAPSGNVLSRDVAWYGIVTADELNVRTWAGTNNGTCSFSPLKYGAEVGVCSSVKASDGSIWYYIKYGNKYGFVHSAYIKKKETSNASTSGGSTKKTATESAKSFSNALAGTYKTTDDLNIRAGAGTNKSIMVTIPKGTTVKNYGYYTEVNGTKWLYVQFTYKNVTYTGFGSGKYLKK